ncbi:MAG: hypothetical protein DI566_07710 [Microbacterium sp.]|nr:MAG: hypothetical protein DI566_07710 [Microbacterium sp.]
MSFLLAPTDHIKARVIDDLFHAPTIIALHVDYLRCATCPLGDVRLIEDGRHVEEHSRRDAETTEAKRKCFEPLATPDAASRDIRTDGSGEGSARGHRNVQNSISDERCVFDRMGLKDSIELCAANMCGPETGEGSVLFTVRGNRQGTSTFICESADLGIGELGARIEDDHRARAPGVRRLLAEHLPPRPGGSMKFDGQAGVDLDEC